MEFESAAVVDNFIQYWRQTGLQRYGIMYGRFEPYEKVPLGVKAVVSAIYEPPQSCGADSIQVTFQSSSSSNTPSSSSSSHFVTSQQEAQVNEMALEVLGLEKVGMIYTDLLDTGDRDGSVVCKRHAESYFLSSAEIIFAAQMQSLHPMVCKYAPQPGGFFGSRFSTCIITGKKEDYKL